MSTTWLSLYNITGCGCEIPKSRRIALSQVIPQQVVAMDLYLVFALDWDMVACFLVFQETNECPRNMQYLVIKRQVSGHLAQSASQKAFN